MQQTVYLADEAATLAFGAQYARRIGAPATVYLNGGLGAGKTTFARGFLRGLGFQGSVKSPTYAIVESYPFDGFSVHHFDLYRFTAPEEWEDAGLDDLPAPDVRLVEWPQQGGAFTPAPDWIFDFAQQQDGRSCTITAVSAAAQQGWNTWQN